MKGVSADIAEIHEQFTPKPVKAIPASKPKTKARKKTAKKKASTKKG